MPLLRRVAALLALTLAGLLAATTFAAAAVPASSPKVDPTQSICIAKETLKLVWAIPRTTWKDRNALATALLAAQAQAKRTCSTPSTPTPPANFAYTFSIDVPPVTLDSAPYQGTMLCADLANHYQAGDTISSGPDATRIQISPHEPVGGTIDVALRPRTDRTGYDFTVTPHRTGDTEDTTTYDVSVGIACQGNRPA